ncbi:MAG TPA: HAMP domain-containing sensor histidine kinase [Gammaproteobacteria bacterium]|nr:HAMP domain-containing sensor histidine kinase [Gammaproteobacteria bacterium]
MSRHSLRIRLLLAAAVSVCIALALAAAGLALLFQRHVERRVDAELAVQLDQVVAGLARTATGTPAVSRPPADPRFDEPLSGLYWEVTSEDGSLRSRSLWDERLMLPNDQLADGAVHRHRISGPGGSELIVLERSFTLPVRLGGGSMRASVALDATEVTTARREFLVNLVPYLLLIALCLILAAYAQVRVGLRPLATVRQHLGAIREGKARRLGESFPDEILPLAEQVDALLDAREGALERARARAADLAHGLKTPLQVLACDIERLHALGEHGIAGEIEQVASMMKRHVDRELARARMAAGSGDARACAADVVAQVVAVIKRTPVGARCDWSVAMPADTTVRIDPDDLAELVGNVIENASRYARSRVDIRTVRQDGFLVITVADDGPGIPEERLEDVQARGAQIQPSGGGAGLGLAIARDITEAWEGRMEIRSQSTGLEVDIAVRC